MDEPYRTERTDTVVSLVRREFLVTTGSLGLAAVLAGCGGQEGPGVGTPTPTPTGGTNETATPDGTAIPTGARVRFAHLSPDAPTVDVSVDGSVVLEDVAFGTVGEYLEMPAGRHTVRITAAGNDQQTVFDGAVNLTVGTAQTFVVLGELEQNADEPIRPLVLNDENDPPDGGTARLRVVHASPDAPTVDVTAGDTVLFDGLSFGDAEYTEVQAGDYTVEIRADTPTNDGDVVATTDVSLAGGEVYTTFAAGYLTPGDEPANTPFELIVVQDTAAG